MALRDVHIEDVATDGLDAGARAPGVVGIDPDGGLATVDEDDVGLGPLGAKRVQQLGEHAVGLHVLRLLRDHLPQHLLAARCVARRRVDPRRQKHDVGAIGLSGHFRFHERLGSGRTAFL